MPSTTYQRSVETGLLSDRQLQVIEGMTDGLRLQDVAKRLNISASAARQHAHRIYKAVGVKNRRELLDWIGYQQDPEIAALYKLHEVIGKYLEAAESLKEVAKAYKESLNICNTP